MSGPTWTPLQIMQDVLSLRRVLIEKYDYSDEQADAIAIDECLEKYAESKAECEAFKRKRIEDDIERYQVGPRARLLASRSAL